MQTVNSWSRWLKWVLVSTIRMQNVCSLSRRCRAWSLVTSPAFHPLLPGLWCAGLISPCVCSFLLGLIPPLPIACSTLPPPRSPFGSYSASDPSLISLPHRSTPRTLTPPGSGRGPSQKCWSDTCPGQVGWRVRSQKLNRPYTVVRFHE